VGNLDLRLRKLEARAPTVTKEGTDDPAVVAAWTAKLDARLDAIHAEAAHRQSLPFAEQLRLLQTDHDQEILERARQRVIGAPHDAGLEAFADRVHEISVRSLEQQIWEGDRSGKQQANDQNVVAGPQWHQA
jgi:hypothetical protein